MMFRKKPIVVEAIEFQGAGSVVEREVLEAFIGTAGRYDFDTGHYLIDTLEGTLRARPGDWIVKGVRGEFYPVRADIFAETFEVVSDVVSRLLETGEARDPKTPDRRA
jgi:hypothetical protein